MEQDLAILSSIGASNSMNHWFRKNLGDAMLAAPLLDPIKAHYLTEFGLANDCNEAAIFVRHESEGRLHCELNVYFSPATFVVAKAAAAHPCNKPTPDGLSLLAGSESAWSILFSENAS